MQEKESIMSIKLRSAFSTGIINPQDDRAVWYLGGASVPPGPVNPQVENADLKLMPIIDSHSPIMQTHPCNILQFFHGCKNDNFLMKNCDVFLIFAQNIDRWYMLELPH